MDKVEIKLDAAEAPTPWGQTIVTPTGSVQYNISTPHQDRFVTESGFVVINLSYDVTELAVNSDKVQTLRTPSDCVVFIPPGSEVFERSDGGTESIMLNINEKYWDGITNLTECDRHSKNRDYLSIQHTQLGDIGRVFRQAFILGTVDPLLFDSLIVEAHQHLANGIRNKFETVDCFPLSLATMTCIREYINANLANTITLEDLAELANLSVYHFVRAFKNTAGITPYREVIYQRVRFARLLLRERAYPIVDVALRAGFSSQSHMTSVFRSCLGVTPAQYREVVRT